MLVCFGNRNFKSLFEYPLNEERVKRGQKIEFNQLFAAKHCPFSEAKSKKAEFFTVISEYFGH